LRLLWSSINVFALNFASETLGRSHRLSNDYQDNFAFFSRSPSFFRLKNCEGGEIKHIDLRFVNPG
jgi:hypothetical protein